MPDREEIQLIKELDSIKSNKTASELIKRVFDDILVSYKEKAYHSPYHEHVKKHGYPLSRDDINNDFYVKRPKIEKKLSEVIKSGKSVVVLGCEGSGKTTLIHRVVGMHVEHHRFIYVDTSDLEISKSDDIFFRALLNRILEAILNSCDEDSRKSFDKWISKIKESNSLLKAKFRNEEPEEVIQNYLSWICVTIKDPFYIIIDNIDSLSVEAGKAVFSYLNQLHTAIISKSSEIDKGRDHSIRLIVSCRTTTYRYISAVSTGMFVNWKPEPIEVEDELRENISVPKLMDRFLKLEYKNEFNKFKSIRQEIPILRTQSTMGSSFGAYVDTITEYLNKSEGTINSVIKPFCGRSIRRMKIYGLRAYASPVIAMLAHLEEQGVVGFSRDNPKYVKRRIYESLFDFRISGKIDNAISVGFPINLFRVIEDEDEFKRNPLLGVTAIILLHENWEKYADEEIIFAQNIKTDEFIYSLKNNGFSDASIRSLFSVLTASGMLRPIPSSKIEMKSEGQDLSIRSNYILDEKSLSSYYNILCCNNIDKSIQYFNASVRYKYECGYHARSDSFQYECLLNLVFISDILHREKQLAEISSRSGMSFQSFSSRIKGSLIPFWRRHLSNSLSDIQDRKTAAHIKNDTYDMRLYEMNSRLFESVVRDISKSESWI